MFFLLWWEFFILKSDVTIIYIFTYTLPALSVSLLPSSPLPHTVATTAQLPSKSRHIMWPGHGDFPLLPPPPALSPPAPHLARISLAAPAGSCSSTDRPTTHRQPRQVRASSRPLLLPGRRPAINGCRFGSRCSAPRLGTGRSYNLI